MIEHNPAESRGERVVYDDSPAPSEARLRAMVDKSAEAVALIGRDGRFLFVSASTQYVLGYSPQDMIGRDIFELMHPEDTARGREVMTWWLAHPGEPRRAEYRYRDSHDEWRHMEADGVSRVDDPAVGAIIVSFRNVDERKRIERALVDNDERFRQLVEHVEAVFWIRVPATARDTPARFLYVSSAFEAITGVEVAQVIADPQVLDDMILAPDREAVHAARLQANDNALELEYRIRRGDGSVRWVRTRSFPIRNAQGQAERVVGISEDITERKAAEESLQQFMSLSHDLLCIGGFDGRFRELSPGWIETLGWTLAELKTQRVIDFVHAQDRAATIAALAKVRHGVALRGFENRCRCRDGSYRWLAWSATVSQPQQLFFGVAYDVTERRRREDVLRHDALHDPLTELPNRVALVHRLARMLARAKHATNSKVAVLYLDLDGFKGVNDGFGHAEGDGLLIQAARRLESAVRPGDLVSRMGGDEFVVVMEDNEGGQAAHAVAERIRDAFRTPFQVAGTPVSAPASVGVALSDEGADEPQDLLRAADLAMYAVKVAAKRRPHPTLSAGAH